MKASLYWILLALLVGHSQGEKWKHRWFQNEGHRSLDDVANTYLPPIATVRDSDLSGGHSPKIENLLNRFSEHVCERFKTLERRSFLCNCRDLDGSDDDDKSCRDWLQETPLPPVRENTKTTLENHYETLKNDIAELRLAMNQCCAGSGNSNGLLQQLNSAMFPIIKNQQEIMADLSKLSESVASMKHDDQANIKKIMRAFEQASVQFQAGYQKIEFGMEKQLTKLSDLRNCPTSAEPELKEIGNKPVKKEWVIKQSPIPSPMTRKLEFDDD